VPPELIRAGLRLGLMVLLLAVGALAFLRPTSAEFWVSVMAVIVAGVFVAGLVVLLSISHQSPPGKG
jgi:hypothetical protein